MKILVCIKQVPDTADIQWTKNNTLKRDGIESIINPFDEYALETALKIKDSIPTSEITALSMGPKQAESALKEALALGCDKAILLSDKKFSAADTVATSTTISSAIKKFLSDTDLIICGQFATDGDTAQTGVGIAEKLKLPQATYVRKILEIDETSITVEKEGEYGIAVLKLRLPALICVQKCDFELRRAKINGYIFAHETKVEEISLEKLGMDENLAGMKGSPTYVSKAFRPETSHNVQFIEIHQAAEIISDIKMELNNV